MCMILPSLARMTGYGCSVVDVSSGRHSKGKPESISRGWCQTKYSKIFSYCLRGPLAGRIPQSFIDDLLARTDLVELIRARVRLKKAGKNYSGLCPFHDEKTPSFSVI